MPKKGPHDLTHALSTCDLLLLLCLLQYLRHLCIEDMAWDPGPLRLLQGSKDTIRGVCPECGNGAHGDDCFAITVGADDSGLAAQLLWCCHRATCGNSGSLSIYRHVDSVQKALQKAAFTRMAPQPNIQPLAGDVPNTRVWQEQKQQLLLLQQPQAQPTPPAVQVSKTGATTDSKHTPQLMPEAGACGWCNTQRHVGCH